MGIVIAFRHARAPAVCRAPSRAKASKVISGRPRSPAKATIRDQLTPGIEPRARQLLTVESAKDRAFATSPVPPRSSMIEPAVTAMDPVIVRIMRTRQECADCETTQSPPHVDIRGMIDAPEVIGARLKAIRLALEFKSQVAFAKALGVEKNTYNPWEKGTRPLTFEAACRIHNKFRIPLDYLFWGESAEEIPAKVYRRLNEAA